MNKAKVQNLLRTFLAAGVLKEVQRTGWVLKGIEKVESVADHSWRMSFMVLLLTPEKLDRQKVLEMCIIHDLGEAGIGDIKWESGTKTISPQKIKHVDETNAINSILEGHLSKERIASLHLEFDEQKTPEAKFLKQIDKLEMAFQALEYEIKGYPNDWFDEFWENAEMYLKGKELEPLFRALEKKRKSL